MFLGPWFQVASIVGVLNELDSPLPWYQFMNCSVSFAETAAWTTCTVSLGLMRQPTIDKLANGKTEDIGYFCNFIQQPQIQKPMGMYLEALKKKSKK